VPRVVRQCGGVEGAGTAWEQAERQLEADNWFELTVAGSCDSVRKLRWNAWMDGREGKLAGVPLIHAAGCWKGVEYARTCCQQMLNEDILEKSIGIDVSLQTRKVYLWHHAPR
jgi:hypothetical protein